MENPIIHGFPPIINSVSEILILGSMPSRRSLELNQYYAYQYNQFWRIAYDLFQENRSDDYDERLVFLLQHKIALWDVFQACQREGSLDSQIKEAVVNNFELLHQLYPRIRVIFFNGSKAYNSYDREVGERFLKREYLIKLPSTSPAYTLPYPEKLKIWKKILDFYVMI